MLLCRDVGKKGIERGKASSFSRPPFFQVSFDGAVAASICYQGGEEGTEVDIRTFLPSSSFFAGEMYTVINVGQRQ